FLPSLKAGKRITKCYCEDEHPTEAVDKNACNNFCYNDKINRCGGLLLLSIYEIIAIRDNRTEFSRVNRSSHSIDEPSLFLELTNYDLYLQLIKENIDLNNCLVNCSNKGECKLKSEDKVECSCFENFTGEKCQYNKRVCSREKCLNGGTCIESSNKTSPYEFDCICSQNYYGKNCELMFDFCENKTCSSNGYCYFNETEKSSKCKCFNLFSGVNCEYESQEIKTIKTTIRISTFIAIGIIICVVAIFVLIDLTNFFCPLKTRKLKWKNETFKQKHIIQFF
ncbi:unnamed protein product, partial [Brachionus calyciflorus]